MLSWCKPRVVKHKLVVSREVACEETGPLGPIATEQLRCYLTERKYRWGGSNSEGSFVFIVVQSPPAELSKTFCPSSQSLIVVEIFVFRSVCFLARYMHRVNDAGFILYAIDQEEDWNSVVVHDLFTILRLPIWILIWCNTLRDGMLSKTINILLRHKQSLAFLWKNLCVRWDLEKNQAFVSQRLLSRSSWNFVCT